MTNRDYFEEANRYVNEEYSNIVGSMEFSSADGWGEDFNVDGNARVPYATTSQPIILQIENSTAAAVTAVLFNPYVNRTASNFSNNVAITVTSSISTTSYAAILAQLESGYLQVAEMYLQTISGSNAQITQPITVIETDPQTGNQSTRTFIPQKDPNQNQTDVNVVKFVHVLSGTTEYSISILASTTLQLSIYPSANYRVGRQPVQGSAVKDYTNPQIIRPLTIASKNALGM
jgi:hypothetical protein